MSINEKIIRVLIPILVIGLIVCAIFVVQQSSQMKSFHERLAEQADQQAQFHGQLAEQGEQLSRIEDK